MDNSYFYIILMFRRLNEASSSRSIRRINGDNEFYSIYPDGKGSVHFFIFGLSAIRPRDAVRTLNYTLRECVVHTMLRKVHTER